MVHPEQYYPRSFALHVRFALSALFLHPSAEPSLDGVDPLISKLKLKIRRVDGEILDAVRDQSSSGTKAKEDLDNAMSAIQARLEQVYPCVKMVV